jgi:ATP-dependent DNA helicase DinG
VKAIENSGGSGFFDYQVPKAALALKQGFGRLIRSTADRGVLVMLDRRIQHVNYGNIFIESLPQYRMTNEISDVQKFMVQGAVEPPGVIERRGQMDDRRTECAIR